MKSLNMSRRKQIDDRKRLLVRYRIDEKGFVSFIDPCCDDIPAALLGKILEAISNVENGIVDLLMTLILFHPI